MPNPRLIHPVAIGIRQLSRAGTLVDDDFREPSGDADRSKSFTVPGQVKWFDMERFQATQMGPEAHADGYVLFRLSDLRRALIDRIHIGDRFVTMGQGLNQVEVDVYVNNLRYMGHYSDTKGPTLVRCYFKDRQPTKVATNPVVDLGLASVWLSSEVGNLFGILASQLAQNGSIGADLSFALEEDPRSFDFDAEGQLWTLAGSPAWLRSYPGSSLERSGSPVAELVIRTPLARPMRMFFDQIFYSGAWCVDGGAGALGRFSPGQLASSSESIVVPATYVTLAIGAAVGSSEPVDFATDASGWGYLAHRRTGASGGLCVWALNPSQLASPGSGVVPINQNIGSNFVGNPSGITVAADGAVWVSFFNTNQIARFSAAALRAGGNPAPSVLIDSSSLVGPVGLAFDGAGDLWVASRTNGRLLRFAALDLLASGTKTPARELVLGAPTDPYGLRLV